ncbi:MAG: hypothetical protein R8G66_32790 [Cytophagales bacterium]|nr:hypothetical protein [Cytophagales bacterium]
MGYLDTVNTLLNDSSVDSKYYVKVQSLLTYIHQGKYIGDPKIISDLDQFKKIRDKKISEGRSTKSVLSATDSQVYVYHTIWKRIASKELLGSTLDQAYFLLEHLSNRADKKDVKIANLEYRIIDQLRAAIEAGSMDVDLLKTPKIITFLEDINPYKNLEGYLKDPAQLEHKTKSRWRQELPLLFIVLGIDVELFRTFLEEENTFLDQSTKTQTNELSPEGAPPASVTPGSAFYQKIYDLPSWLKALTLILITVATVIGLSQLGFNSRAEDLKPEELPEVFNVVDKPLQSSKIFSPFSPITTTVTPRDSLVLQVKQIESEEVLSGEIEIPVQAIELEILIQNTSQRSGYVFEGLQITTLQNYKVEGHLLAQGVPRNNAHLEEITLACIKDAVQYRAIVNGSRSVLIPQQETVCSLKLILSESCVTPKIGHQVVPLMIGFTVQNVKDSKARNKLVELKDPVAIAIR